MDAEIGTPIDGPAPTQARRIGRPKGTRNKTRAPQRTAQRMMPQDAPPPDMPVAPRTITLRGPEHRFDVDTRKRPAGMTYEWKRVSVMGAEDEEHQINLAMNGWTPVPAERHPELMGLNPKKGGHIKRGGQVLMERPNELTALSRTMEGDRAREQVNTQLRRVGKQSVDAGAGRATKRVRDFEEIPED